MSETMLELHQFIHPVVLMIVALSAFTYYRLILAALTHRVGYCQQQHHWQISLNMCICALPLLGLLGTIGGLLDTFSAMAAGQQVKEGNQLTEGISDALWTTQLGLIMAVPAWLLYSLTERQSRRAQLKNQLESSEQIKWEIPYGR